MATVSPTLTRTFRTSPPLMPSPRLGMLKTVVSPPPDGGAAAAAAAGAAGAAGAAPWGAEAAGGGDAGAAGAGAAACGGAPADAPSFSVSTTCPIVTLSPLLTLISATVPAIDDGTSMVALSVSSSRTP